VKRQAFSAQLTVKEFCENKILKDTESDTPGIYELHRCVVNINATLNFLENFMRRTDYSIVEDTGLPELLKTLRQEMKNLRRIILLYMLSEKRELSEWQKRAMR